MSLEAEIDAQTSALMTDLLEIVRRGAIAEVRRLFASLEDATPAPSRAPSRARRSPPPPARPARPAARAPAKAPALPATVARAEPEEEQAPVLWRPGAKVPARVPEAPRPSAFQPPVAIKKIPPRKERRRRQAPSPAPAPEPIAATPATPEGPATWKWGIVKRPARARPEVAPGAETADAPGEAGAAPASAPPAKLAPSPPASAPPSKLPSPPASARPSTDPGR